MIGCGRISFDPQDVAVVTVEPRYPASGASWNDYVKNDGADRYSATDTPCTAAEQGHAACIHGGERRQVATGIASCAGLRARDALDAFAWICRVDNGGAVFYSSGFAPRRGLQHLVDPAGWLPNHVEIRRGGTLVAASEPTVWWTNPVLPVPANPSVADSAIVLDAVDDDGAGPDVAIAPGTIIIVPTSTTSSGYRLGAPRLALVTLPDVTLAYSGNAGPNCADQATPLRCLLSFQDPPYLWIEGRFDGRDASGGANHADVGLSAEGEHCFARVHNAAFARNVRHGVLSAVNSSVFDELTTSDNGGNGIELHRFGRSDLLFSRVTSTSNGGNGMVVLSATRVAVWHGRFANNAISGLELNAQGNSVFDIATYNNGVYGLDLSGGASENPNITVVGAVAFAAGNTSFFVGSQAPTVLGATSVNSGDALYARNPGVTIGATLVQVLATNADLFRLEDTDGARVANLTFTGGTLHPGNNSRFAGNLLVADTSQCDATAAINPGLAGGTCANLGGSTATLQTGIDLSASFVGKVLEDDASNTSDLAGSAPVGTITDWAAFDTPFRGWGLDGSTFPALDHQGRCTAGNCRIWDLRLRATDTMVRNRSGAGGVENEPFVPGARCPSAVHGDSVIDDQQTHDHVPGIHAIELAGDGLGDDDDACEPGEQCFNRFLVAAFEIVDDDIGDDDGLCESDESCIYAPNFGAYQGEGDFMAREPCTFVDGRVQRVRLYAYPINGT